MGMLVVGLRLGPKFLPLAALTAQLKYCTQAAAAAGVSPMQAYNNRVSEGLLVMDEHQAKVMERLNRIYHRISSYSPPKKGFFEKLLKKKKTKVPSEEKIPKGMYVFGAVGGGKTMLMDLFFECCDMDHKRRVHFNAFMQEVHVRIHELKRAMGGPRRDTSTKPQPFDPIPPVAEDISQNAWLLCFDEFQVTDIGDAMILKRLFEELFDRGVVVVATSNRHPDELYKRGLQRANFVPFIQVLKDRCSVVQLDSGVDYRQKVAQPGGQKLYFVKSESDSDEEMNSLFKWLCSRENDVVRPRTLTIRGRNVQFSRTCGGVADLSFEELCERPLGSGDYLQLSQAFHTIFIRDVPQLGLKNKSQARRFITLIDTLYDNRVRVVISADMPHKELFSRNEEQSIDEHRALMDDLNIDLGTENASASIFTGEEEMFAFDRTISRLSEMQTSEYWQAWEKKS